jgi:hypothetical protein
MISPTTAWPEIVVVIAALIGGATSFIITVLTKEQKTSEFRQAWIDALRDDISQYLAGIGVVGASVKSKNACGRGPEDVERWLDKWQEQLTRIQTCFYRINLRLNPRKHARLMVLLESLLNAATVALETSDTTRVESILADVVEETQTVLRSEWTRVKRGEPWFLLTKYSSFLVIALAVFSGTYLAANYLVSGAVGFATGALFGWLAHRVYPKGKSRVT